MEIDEAAAKIKIEMDSKPEVMDKLDRRLIQLQIEREAVPEIGADRRHRVAWLGQLGALRAAVARHRAALGILIGSSNLCVSRISSSLRKRAE